MCVEIIVFLLVCKGVDMSLIDIHKIQSDASKRIGKKCEVNVYHGGDGVVVFDITWQSKDLVNKFSHSVSELEICNSYVDINYMVMFAFETQIKKYKLDTNHHETLMKEK